MRTYLESWAIFSPCGLYRYRLFRRWTPGPTLLLGMLNPSKADGEKPDPTMTKVVGFGERLGFGAVLIGNLGAFVATDPDDFLASFDPIGPENDAHLDAMVAEAAMVIVGWGGNIWKRPWLRDRASKVLRQLTAKTDVYALETGKRGEPSHPLMLSYALQPVLYRAKAVPGG